MRFTLSHLVAAIFLTKLEAIRVKHHYVIFIYKNIHVDEVSCLFSPSASIDHLLYGFSLSIR